MPHATDSRKGFTEFRQAFARQRSSALVEREVLPPSSVI
jgi:hypothetical protein